MASKLKKVHQSDWQKNWGSSIAVKVTAPVFWILISLGLIIATVQQNHFAEELPDLIAVDADRVAYATSKYLLDLEGGQPLELRRVIENSLSEMFFVSGQITVGLRTVEFGDLSADVRGLSKLTRLVPYTNKLQGGDSLIANLTLYHQPYARIIKNARKNMLVKFGVIFFAFGLLLVGLIHIIVTKPISEFVSATKAVSQGDMASRLDNKRQDEFGELTHLFNRMLDQLQNKQEELALAVKVAQSASNAKSAFLANMSHEIRTPLTAILGFSSFLKDTSLNSEQAQQHVDSIMRAGNHLHQIINDILDMSKIEAGQLVIDRTQVALFDMLREIENLMRPYAEEKNLNFRVKFNFPLPRTITTDATRLKQLLLNLCSNAIKFTNDGNIDIGVKYDNKENLLLFDVTDTGVGMTPEEIEHLFVPFSQADSSSTRRYGGTGLGLCICKELATNLGGDILCQSRKGIGSRFSFHIDPGEMSNICLIDEPEQQKAELENSVVSLEPGSLTGKVLLAEDTLDNQKLIAMYVSSTGATTTVVDNGKKAVDLALQEDFDLILMDMQMPVMGGVDATARLRSLGYDKPIVALTANALLEDREKSMRAGVDDYLTKPVDLGRFSAVLNRYLKPVMEQQSSVVEKAVFDDAYNLFADDPEFQALVRRFEAELPGRLAEIQLALSQQNWVELKSLVHKLKGLGSSFGYPQLSSIAADIQTDLVNGVTSSVADLVQQLTDCYHHTFERNKKSSNF